MSWLGGLWRKRRRVIALAAVGVVGSSGGVGTAAHDDPTPPSTDPTQATGSRCIVRLHGKGNSGADTYVEDGVVNVLPDGNAEGWGGRQWVYFPDESYEEARAIVADAIESAGCDDVMIHGFSNGGAFAAKLYCRGETFGGRVFRYIVDDPVPDEGVVGCHPAPDTEVVLYWTGALAENAQAGRSCSEIDWTCEGGVSIGIDAYAEMLGVEVLASPHTEHEWYWDAPELADWTRPEPATTMAGSTEPPATTESISSSFRLLATRKLI